MKKSLSLLLAVAMVFSMFASAALAADADLTAQQKFDALKEAGIFAGYEDGTAGLDKEMTRAQFARVAGLVAGLDVDATVTASSFVDVPVTHWAVEEIEAAVAAGLLVGKGDDKYDPQGNVTVQQLAVVVAKLLGLTEVEDAEVEGAADWAAGSVQAIINAGIAFPTNYADNATRGQLVEVTYTVAGNNAPVGTAFTAAATSAKKITVTFNGAVDDSKVKVTLWNGTNQVNTKSTTFAEDKKSVVLEFANNLPEAEYTVKVEGLSEEAQTQTVKVEAEKVASIKFNSDKAALVRGDDTKITTGYTVLNQYGDTINDTALSPTAGKGTASAASGTLTVDADSNFVLGEKVTVSLVHASGTFATAVLEVGSVAQVATVDIVKLRQADNKELVEGSTETFQLVLDLKDQYGNSVTDDTYLDGASSDLIVSVSNQSAASVKAYDAANSHANFDTPTIDGTKTVVLELAQFNNGTDTKFRAGTSTITILSKTTGAKDSFDVVVKASVHVDSLTLSAPSSAPANSTVNIPFTAVDQFGDVIVHPTDGQVTSLSISTGGTVKFEKDIAKNVTNLKATLGAKGTAIVTIITKTNKVAQLTINVTDGKVPTVITATKNFDTSLLKDGGKSVINKDRIVVKDQYGNDASLTWGSAPGEYRVKVESSDTSKVSLTKTHVDDNYVDNDDTVTLNAVAKGSSTITLTLQKNDAGTWKDVSNSSYSFNSKVVAKDEIESYSATVSGTVYTTATAAYNKELVVKGNLADGSTVTVPYNSGGNYSVTITTAGVSLVIDGDATKINAATYAGFGDESTKEITVLAIVEGTSTETIPVKVSVSKSAPAATTLSLKDSGGNGTKVSDGFVKIDDTNVTGIADVRTLARGIVKVVDQYGQELTHDASLTPDANIIVTNISNGHAVNALVEEDTFTVTLITGNGKDISFKVIVE